MAVDCVIGSESGGACRELEGEAPARVHSSWGEEGRRKSREQTLGETKQKMERRRKRSEESEWHKQRENKQRRRRSRGERGERNERQRISKSEMEKKKIRPPILKIREGVVVVCAGQLGLWSTEDVLKQRCLEFILSCHAVSEPLSGISFCKD